MRHIGNLDEAYEHDVSLLARACVESMERGIELALTVINCALNRDPLGMLNAAGDYLNGCDALATGDEDTFDRATKALTQLLSQGNA